MKNNGTFFLFLFRRTILIYTFRTIMTDNLVQYQRIFVVFNLNWTKTINIYLSKLKIFVGVNAPPPGGLRTI